MAQTLDGFAALAMTISMICAAHHRPPESERRTPEDEIAKMVENVRVGEIP
jgi:hypothetical protein